MELGFGNHEGIDKEYVIWKKKTFAQLWLFYHYLILFAFDNKGELRFNWTVMSIVEVNTETMLRLS